MRVLYDHQAFTMQYYGGVSKCFCELISHLPPEVDYSIGIKESNNVHLQNTNICPEINSVSIDYQTFISKYRFKGKGKCFQLLKFLNYPTAENLNRNKSIKLLKEGAFDIFHPTFFDDYFLKYLNGKPFVLTIHDMMPELFPEYYKRNDMQILAKQKLVNKAAAIIAVSEQTKNDIIDILDVPASKIHVVYHGGPKIEYLKNDSLYEFPYFLYVGQRNAYKNFIQILDEFSQFIHTHHNVKLVCTGPSFSEEEELSIKRLTLNENIIHKKASDQELKNLYANAIAFIYPSLYEGFGMPILEAYAYGCPVLLNNKSCFPEIAGDAAIYFETDKYSSNFLQALNYIYNLSTSSRLEIINRGYKRLAVFSWDNSANKLYNIYKSIIK